MRNKQKKFQKEFVFCPNTGTYHTIHPRRNLKDSCFNAIITYYVVYVKNICMHVSLALKLITDSKQGKRNFTGIDFAQCCYVFPKWLTPWVNLFVIKLIRNFKSTRHGNPIRRYNVSNIGNLINASGVLCVPGFTT